MSVYKRPGSDTYSYDFVCGGHRFSGSTELKDRRKAEAFEEQLRREAKKSKSDAPGGMTFGAASTRFWEEVGQYHAQSDGTWKALGWLQGEIGKGTALSSIADAVVARLVAKRRAETRISIVKGERKEVPISPATVNRSMTEPLRNLLRRAEKLWGQTLPKIDWREHKLKEPQERVREASRGEEATLLASLPEDYRAPVSFAILTGCRRAEIVGLTWPSVNFEAGEFQVTGKGDLTRTIPMTAAVEELLRSLAGQHPTAVFTFKAQRTRDGRVKGTRYPITDPGFETAWNRHARKKLVDFKFHDTRHTAATRLVRATGSIKMAQKLLGHSDIATTSRYAHVTHDDLRQGMEAAAAVGSPTKSPTKRRSTSYKHVKLKEKSGA